MVWLDTETTGLNPDKNDIIEFAGLREDTLETLHLKVYPERPENAHPRALEVNGYTREKWDEAGAIEMASAIPQIAKFLEGAILAGQNVSFDENFIKATMRRHDVETRIGYHKLDVATLALIRLRPLGAKSVSLGYVCDVLGISNEGAHTALADVHRARLAYYTLLDPPGGEADIWRERIEAMD
jgi:DNA polymerase-3 subunit epsilon